MSKLSRFKPDFTVGNQKYYANSSIVLNNYLKCDGSILSQNTYSELYNEIGLIQDLLDDWYLVNSLSIGYALTYGNGIFVYISGTNLFTSTNGVSFLSNPGGSPPLGGNIAYALTYGNGLYLYAGGGGILGTSTDGATFTSRTSGTTSTIYALTYGNNIYVYAGAGGVLRTSTDGITWDSRTSGTTSIIRSLTYGNNLYVYAGDGGTIGTSTDGITWTARTSGTTNIIYSLAYGNPAGPNLYLYGGDAGVLASSTDAITWTIRTAETTSSILALAYGNDIFTLIDNALFGRSLIYSYDQSTDFALPKTINNSDTPYFDLAAYIKYK